MPAQSATNVSYLRPRDSEWVDELEVKRSQFIAIARRTATELEARTFIDDVRSRYPDARHHCTAFIVHMDKAQPIERSSDDGEPAGTAGQPMLEALRGSGLLDITVVVVRYFGGVKLGTGGLVRAYHDATKGVLSKIDVVSRQQLELFSVSVPHADAGRVEAEIRDAGVDVVDVEYTVEAVMTLAVKPGVDMGGVIAKITSGQVTPKNAGTTWVDIPVCT
ncbi:IMPACT family protein [Corynebacterium anserum]|uniref:DUF1949 domain-containing protein n=1 Tax=Corynebacterium anserum TaxID=2684406 RepID=A0A7G7YN07_9CORY|nr:YigZ family protein [Corynebacterium anserum]QNH95877.1 DUF1949 domain-containing protein [Corynebacterium anserum]